MLKLLLRVDGGSCTVVHRIDKGCGGRGKVRINEGGKRVSDQLLVEAVNCLEARFPHLVGIDSCDAELWMKREWEE
jgi:hypothetical protein